MAEQNNFKIPTFESLPTNKFLDYIPKMIVHFVQLGLKIEKFFFVSNVQSELFESIL